MMDKHIIVTGGGSGVGAATAQALAQAGARVTIMGRRESALREQGLPYQICDVTDAEAVAQALAAARDAQGPILGVVANAGAAESLPFAKMPSGMLADLLAVILIGVANVWQTALPDMKAAGWGRMVAVASTAGLKGYARVAPYAAAKHGVVGMVRSLALEVARGPVTVNAICPGFLDTEMTDQSVQVISEKTGRTPGEARAVLAAMSPQNRLYRPDEVTATALFLCGAGSEGINGQSIAIAGGEI